MNKRRIAFKETRDRKIERHYARLCDAQTQDEPIAALDGQSDVPQICSYGYRTFDRQWVLSDSRLGDFMRPELWRSHSRKQVYMTGLLTDVLGFGPAAVATADIPDLHHFHGRGAKDVVPLWRDAHANQPNVTTGLLEAIGAVNGMPLSAEQLFAYAYGVLVQPSYVDRFWEELELPPPRLPITKDPGLFRRVAEHGAHLLHVHTFGERFSRPDGERSPPHGMARCTNEVSSETYPQDYTYDPLSEVLFVGEGRFEPVSHKVWNYSVSGLQIVKSWLDRRKLKPTGRKSSPLDEIRPERWEFTEELLRLLWVLEETVELQPRGADLLEEVCASELFSREELPTPGNDERKPPRLRPKEAGQAEFDSAESD